MVTMYWAMTGSKMRLKTCNKGGLPPNSRGDLPRSMKQYSNTGNRGLSPIGLFYASPILYRPYRLGMFITRQELVARASHA